MKATTLTALCFTVGALAVTAVVIALIASGYVAEGIRFAEGTGLVFSITLFLIVLST